MTSESLGLTGIASSAEPRIRVVVASAEGSAPREAGAVMLVSAESTAGTIGGGQLEFEAIAHARAMLSAAGTGSGLWRRDLRSWPLGPSLGQCCGGAVRILFELYASGEADALQGGIAAGRTDLAPRPVASGEADALQGGIAAERTDLAPRPVASGEADALQGGIAAGRTGLLLRPAASGEAPRIVADRAEARELPLHVARVVSDMLSGARRSAPVLLPARKGAEAWFIEPFGEAPKRLFLYGAGHVGRAIVKVLADLEFIVDWIDVSAVRFPTILPGGAVVPIVASDPAAVAGAAPAGAYHLVLTFSHALDLAICHALLANPVFGFLGLIGSQSKRARFMKRLAEGGIPPAALARLTCPIGIGALRGKEPATIAISVAAQLIEQLEQERGLARDKEEKLEQSTRYSA